MKAITKTALVSVVLAAAAQASAQVTFFQEQDFQGRSFTTAQLLGDAEAIRLCQASEDAIDEIDQFCRAHGIDAGTKRSR